MAHLYTECEKESSFLGQQNRRFGHSLRILYHGVILARKSDTFRRNSSVSHSVTAAIGHMSSNRSKSVKLRANDLLRIWENTYDWMATQ